MTGVVDRAVKATVSSGLTLMMVSIIAGCASNTQPGVDMNKYRQIRDGVTTKGEVYRMFGTPTDEMPTKDGKTLLVYKVTKMEQSAVGTVPCLNVLYNPMTFNYQTLALLIGPNARVEKHLLKEDKHKARADIFGTPW